MYAPTSPNHTSTLTKRPLGVRLLTLHAAVFAGLLPLAVRIWLLDTGQFNGADPLLFWSTLLINIAMLPAAYLTWNGNRRARWAFLGLVAAHYLGEIIINLDAAQLPGLYPEIAERYKIVALRSGLWIPIVLGYFALPRVRAWFAAQQKTPNAWYRDDRGSSVAQAAAVAIFAVLVLGALVLGTQRLGPGVQQSLVCLASSIGGSGAGCATGSSTTDTATQHAEQPAEAEEDDDDGGSWWDTALDITQGVLDVAGFVPGLGEIADGANALISLGRGNYADAALSAAAMVPFLGWGATATKWGKRGVDLANAADTANDGRRTADNVADGADAAGDQTRRNADAEDLLQRDPCISMAPTQRVAGLAAPLVADNCLVPGTAAHREQRWQEYQERGGTWSRERWDRAYDVNMEQARKAREAAEAYRREIGWGEAEVTVRIDDSGTTRRIDIADVDAQRGIEYKTGYTTYDEAIRSEVERDALLVQQGWDIEWVFEGRASQPLLDALDAAGIPYIIR